MHPAQTHHALDSFEEPPFQEVYQIGDKFETEEVYGQYLEHFKKVKREDRIGSDETPLIFYILANYFRHDPTRFNTEGLFRVSNSKDQLIQIELNTAVGNYEVLKQEEDGCIVANYWKRVLINMREPLVPYDFYEPFGKLDQQPEDEQ